MTSSDGREKGEVAGTNYIRGSDDGRDNGERLRRSPTHVQLAPAR